ncbi:purine-binding chemotaxis protein CheW [Halobacillus alkaliphilus]|uniref:Purine-binding chemotaxis protein CheW n=1 Tax=Halobacillus alkaliphilus TaxID=396056 RepID=A0A1I2L0B3_9BACI|nr:chemotaxis protein CheW [Halobacillus alkaliphilus]SFF70771.1 purine-binding chemotaxis protein CheW [Halobacillus alkaliphilus]
MEEMSSFLKVIVFQLNEEEYTIPVHQVGSIERIMAITRVPGTAPFVKGVINLRGVVTPIIDLGERLGMESTRITEQTRIITVKIGDLAVGLIVEGANDVLDINQELIEPSPEAIGTEDLEFIQGVVHLEQRLLVLLNLEKVLSLEEALDWKKAEV